MNKFNFREKKTDIFSYILNMKFLRADFYWFRMMGLGGGGEFSMSPDETSGFKTQFRALPSLQGKVNADLGQNIQNSKNNFGRVSSK